MEWLHIWFFESNLSWEERTVGVPLHQEHIDEVDEDAGSCLRVSDCEKQPLIDDHEHQIAEETQQEEQLRNKYQVQIICPSEVPEQKNI